MGRANVRGDLHLGRAPHRLRECTDRIMLCGDRHERMHGPSACPWCGARVPNARCVDGDGRRCKPHVCDDRADEDGEYGDDRPCGIGDVEWALGDGSRAWEHEPWK